jgi:hypothetical protein
MESARKRSMQMIDLPPSAGDCDLPKQQYYLQNRVCDQILKGFRLSMPQLD